MHIKKLDALYFILFIICFWPIVTLSQPIIHHDLTVKLAPKKNQIHVVDKIDLTTGHKKNTPRAFLIHAGENINIIEKNIGLKKQNYIFAKKHFPHLIGDDLTVGTVPVDVYSLDMPKYQKQITLIYQRKIYHTIESGGKEYEHRIHSSSGLIGKQGVFIAKESFWFPVFGDELLTFNLNVTSPLGWKSISQGERVYTGDNTSSHQDTWREMRAQNDIFLVAAKFTEYSQMTDFVNAMAFLRTPDDALAKKYMQTTAQYLTMYRNLLGPYPYSKFALIENFWETGFGMPSFTLLGPRIIRFPFILHSSYPHELLHNWWGNSVYIDYKKGNWAEGLTSYLADHLIKEQRGKGQNYRRSVLQKYTNFANAENDFALATFTSRFDEVTEAIGYGKTLMLFHMLRQTLGDELFSRGLQQFYRQYKHKTASFNDIEQVFSRLSTQDLSPFFSQWVSKTGAPTLALKQAKLEKKSPKKYLMEIEIEQTQPGEAYELTVPAFVSLKNKKMAKKIHLKISQKKTLLSLEFDNQPLRLDIDPEFDVFRRLNIHETPPALSQMFGAKNTLIVLPSKASRKKLQAYEQLAKNWQSTQQSKISIVSDENLNTLPKDKSIWIFGWENQLRDRVLATLKIYEVNLEEKNLIISEQSTLNNESTFVLVGRNPTQDQQGIALLSADTLEAMPGLARKIPHYGKYSYLVFKGQEPTNDLKGQWPVVNSPLSFRFTEGAKSAQREERHALIEMTPALTSHKPQPNINSN